MRWAILLLAPVLTACIGAAPVPPPTTYDFGLGAPPVAMRQPLAGTLGIANVTAPDWLAGDGIIYRLVYDDPARPEIYSQSRWAAPPAKLLTTRLKQRLANLAAGGVTEGGSNVAADYLLRLELEEFSQVFDTRDQSRAVVRARASLIDPQQGTLLAQEEFTAERPAAPAAPGAARGLREASDVVLDQVAHWLVGQAEAAAQRR
jgi:cholesterol transport system auxiliary component